jgi:hypothetical protein
MGKIRRAVRQAAVLSCFLAAGCGGARTELWREEWKQHHVGTRWEWGLDGGAPRDFDVGWGGARFRVRALNQTLDAGTVRIEGAPGAPSWTLGAEAVQDLEWTVPRTGRYSVTASRGMVLAEPRLVRPREDAPLIVLAVADTFRADHLSPMLTPAILEQFRGGRRFANADSNAPWTLPSMASLFTSRPTIELTAPEGDLIAIPEGVSSWAEVLSRRGFAGGAFVSNYTINFPNNFAKGFDEFLVPARPGPVGFPPAEEILGPARAWLSAHKGEPAFLYVHFMDQHDPYHDHEGGMPPMAPITPLASRERAASPDERRQRLAAYASTVRYLDRQLGPFLAELPRQAVAVFTSDHGESFGEHDGCWGHGLTLYREALQVPLVIRGPGVTAGVEDRPVQLLDLIPTLLDLVRVPVPPEMAGRSLLTGGSNVPDVAVTFSAGPLRWRWRDGARVVTVHTRPQPGLAPEGVVKMQEVRPLASGAFLYDLGLDPGEENPKPLDDSLALAAARVFAISVGKMVPGLQVFSAASHGPVAVTFETPAPVKISQVFSIAETKMTFTGGRVELRWDEAYPFALAAFSGRSPATPAPVKGSAWSWLDSSKPIQVGTPGTFLWWDGRAALLQRGHDETIARLRSLGYIR